MAETEHYTLSLVLLVLSSFTDTWSSNMCCVCSACLLGQVSINICSSLRPSHLTLLPSPLPPHLSPLTLLPSPLTPHLSPLTLLSPLPPSPLTLLPSPLSPLHHQLCLISPEGMLQSSHELLSAHPPLHPLHDHHPPSLQHHQGQEGVGVLPEDVGHPDPFLGVDTHPPH